MLNEPPVFGCLLIVASVLAAQTAVQSAGPAGKPPSFKITTKRANDSVQVLQEKAKTVLVIKCPFGISNASIERTGAQWPTELLVRLHLKGLENFKAANGKGTLHAAASVQGGKLTLRQWKNGKENQPLDKTSAWWMENRTLDSGKPATKIPLKDGFFELAIPSAFFDDNPKAITLEWVDFYR
jgi:hypothetical protein